MKADDVLDPADLNLDKILDGAITLEGAVKEFLIPSRRTWGFKPVLERREFRLGLSKSHDSCSLTSRA